MKMGECWYANFQLRHSVENKSSEPRIHLTLDCIRNDWSDKLFAEMGFDLNFSSEKNQYSEEMKQKIIAELSLNPTEAGAKIIANLLAE